MNDYITLNSYELVDGRRFELRISAATKRRTVASLHHGSFFSVRGAGPFEVLSDSVWDNQDGTVSFRYGSAPYQGGAWEQTISSDSYVDVHEWDEVEVTR